jgi:hypothetical protein
MTEDRGASPQPDTNALAFHSETLVFDCLSLLYVLDEPYTSRMHAAGVDVTNLTVAAETETWDETPRIVESALDKIEASPLLASATSATDILAAKKAGKTAVILDTQGASMIDT